jgi:hypothetical protein
MYQTSEYKSAAVASHSCTKTALLSFCLLFAPSFQLMAQHSVQNVSLHPQINYFFRTGTNVINNQLCDSSLRNDLLLFSSPPGFSERERTKFNRMGLIKRRTKIIAATNIIGYSGAMVGLYAAWYKNAYSAYAESKASMELWRWTGIDRKKRIWLGGMSGAVYQTVIETLDGFSSEWGWSWGDFGANILGSGMLVAQELAWDEQRIQFKFSFHRKFYNDPILNQRSDKIFGNSTAERFLKDYSGQTYWLSANLKSFFPKSNLPAWLQISVGTGAEGLFGANENIGKDDNGTMNFNRTDIKRYRQWYLAPDVDLTKIKTNKKGIKVALNILNIVKFPMPSLEYSNGRFRLNALTF